jgi:hypothetical protein
MKDPHGPRIVKVFHEALDILDQSEPLVRDLIECRLMNVAGVNNTKVSDAMLKRDDLTKEVIRIRQHHIKAAFRHLRDNLPSDI